MSAPTDVQRHHGSGDLSGSASARAAKAARRFDGASPHEWVSFEDPDEERTWVFDVTFLMSAWTCIYGAGCPGIEDSPAPERAIGCCSHGAHLADKADVSKVKRFAERLTDEQWQFRSLALRSGSIPKGTLAKDEESGDTVTRVVEGGCIFLNRPGFPGGPGCAFHRAALEAGDEPLEWKPEVCWQLPIRREDHSQPDGHVLSLVGQWDRKHWGDGGHEFGWWCTEAPEAFVSADPVYRHSRAELVAMTSTRAYEMVASYLDGLATAQTDGTGRALLPHPVVRRKG